MPPFRSTSRLLQATASSSLQASRKPRASLVSRIAASSTRVDPPFPILTECPSPTCPCSPMPPGLDIDHKTPISNNIAPYSSHILISTGQSDWTSRIEDAHKDAATQPWGPLISQVKTAFGRKGPYHSDTQNVLISASSLPTSQDSRRSVLLFPAHEELSIPASPPAAASSVSPEADPDLATLLSYLSTRSSAFSSPSTTTTTPPSPPSPITSTTLAHPTVLICSHTSRDTRCGILGPILHSEFQHVLTSLSIRNNREHSQNQNHNHSHAGQPSLSSARVAMVSHIGGHKWAGNVIIYLPPNWPVPNPIQAKMKDQERERARDEEKGTLAEATEHDADTEEEVKISPLAHQAIWYGRVEPRHVEGIVRETVLGGRVIGELCRGVVDQWGRLIRI